MEGKDGPAHLPPSAKALNNGSYEDHDESCASIEKQTIYKDIGDGGPPSSWRLRDDAERVEVLANDFRPRERSDGIHPEALHGQHGPVVRASETFELEKLNRRTEALPNPKVPLVVKAQIWPFGKAGPVCDRAVGRSSLKVATFPSHEKDLTMSTGH
jgi:hypothetical protein